jgi:hypothetical protein
MPVFLFIDFHNSLQKEWAKALGPSPPATVRSNPAKVLGGSLLITVCNSHVYRMLLQLTNQAFLIEHESYFKKRKQKCVFICWDR